MSRPDQKWLEGGRGLPPELTWSFTADAPLVGLELARETGETVVADAAGSVYLLDRRGRILTLSRGLHSLSGIAWSDSGSAGAIVVGDSTLTVLNRQLSAVRRQRETRRAAPHGEPLVALVGYTNVGKSSLLNAMARSDALVANQPFATLDPTVRRAYLDPKTSVRLADTVGFITDLPKDLINAFRATLEELREADRLVHVLDASNPDWPRQRAAVDAILHELELDRTPRIVVFNKCDAAPPGELPHEPGALFVSAKTGAGIEELRARLAEPAA